MKWDDLLPATHPARLPGALACNFRARGIRTTCSRVGLKRWICRRWSLGIGTDRWRLTINLETTKERPPSEWLTEELAPRRERCRDEVELNFEPDAYPVK